MINSMIAAEKVLGGSSQLVSGCPHFISHGFMPFGPGVPQPHVLGTQKNDGSDLG